MEDRLNDKISLIVPVYNVEKELAKCLETIINQTYKNIEIILVNDGSTDNSLTICEHYSKTDKRIQLITQKNQGLSAARNTGLKFANGKFIMFIDSDDYVSKTFCEKAIKLIKKYNSDIAFFDYNLVKDKKVKHITQHFNNGRISKDEALQISLSDSHAWNKIYKASLFKNITYPVGYFYEDTLTTYRLIARGKDFSYRKFATYNYVIRQGSITASGTNKKLVTDSFIADYYRCKYINKYHPKISEDFNKSLINSATHYLVLGDNNPVLISRAEQLLGSKELRVYINFKQRVFINLYKRIPKTFTRLMQWKYKEKD